MPKKIKVGSPAWVKKMAKARKAAAKARKKGGGKKKKSSRKKLEQRIEDLENKLNSVLAKGAHDYDYQARMFQDPEFQAGLKRRDELKRKLDVGDW